MPKKNPDKEFTTMLDELLKDHAKQLLSERIKRGLKHAKRRKSRKQQ